MRTAADLLFCCLRRPVQRSCDVARPAGGGKAILDKVYTASCACACQRISQTHLLLQTSHYFFSSPAALRNRSAYIHNPPPGHASTHSLAGGEWARIRYTALNEQPGHEMKPLISPVRIPSCLWPLAMAAYPWSGRIGCTVLSTAMVSSL